MIAEKTSTERLVQDIETRALARTRTLIAVAGAPGSGKSTLAEYLAGRLGSSAQVLPMDGFHLENEELEQKGLLHRKGAPETFDAVGFLDLVRSLHRDAEVSYPTFDRTADRTVPNGGAISKDTKIVLIEGNYLLLEASPWSELGALFDMTIQLSVDRDVLEKRLVKRWLDQGMPLAAARKRAAENDMRNVDLVLKNSVDAEFVLRV